MLLFLSVVVVVLIFIFSLIYAGLLTTVLFSGAVIIVILAISWVVRSLKHKDGSGQGREEPLGLGINFGKIPGMILGKKELPARRFSDLGGVDEVIEELKRVVQAVKNFDRYQKMGARPLSGVLLFGEPGTGKTALAEALAGECGVSFIPVAGTDFVEMFVGVGAARARDLFKKAKDNAPCIIFIDEIDALGRQRSSGSIQGGQEEREGALTALMTNMSGFEKDRKNIVVVGACNRPDILDPALLRTGRFDLKIVVPRPDLRGRLQILQIHARNKRMASDVDLEVIAQQTPGMVGSDLEAVLNTAALAAVDNDKESINMEEIREAIDKVMMGPARKGLIMPERTRQVIAYHEAGHAIVAHNLPDADIVRKISITARGMSGGQTVFLPQEEVMTSRDRLKVILATLLGGYVAEKTIFGEGGLTTGASNDLMRANEIARSMVVEYGMSSLGPRTFGKREGGYLNPQFMEGVFSEQDGESISQEVSGILTDAGEKAKEIITKHSETLERLVKRLLEVETLEGEALQEILGPKP